MRKFIPTRFALIALGLLPCQIHAADTLSTGSVATCLDDSAIQVQELHMTFTKSTREIVFDVKGMNAEEQNITALLSVTAYGNDVYSKDFDPCSSENFIAQLCPVPTGTFSATGSQKIPEEFASQIPSIAFAIPDLDGLAKLELKSKKDGKEIACIQSGLSNGKTLEIPGISYAAVGVAGAALALSGLSALASAGNPGATSSSPGFGEVMGWFHSMATNGMLSVSYPPVYRSFAKNFAFSTGLIPWGQMQTSIDDFRKATGGNLTQNSYEYLHNTTSSSSVSKRGLDLAIGAVRLIARELETSVNETASGNETVTLGQALDQAADGNFSGIATMSKELYIPQSNTFMTVLLVFAIVVAAIAVGILLFKVILELWALYGSFPQKLASFRKDYWGLLGRTITNLILILYGIWVLYCVYQLSNGDSWAAKLLAGVTLAVFTGILLFFGIRITILARKYRRSEGDASSLYEDRETWRKYSLFYDNYKKDYWWLFVPIIVYMFAKGCVIAAGDGHGLVQSGGQLIIEALLLILLLWYRPFIAKSTQWINISIQVVRVLSVACILVFVEELGLSQTTKTVTGIVLIAVQSALTGILAILIAVNAIILCCRENPHARRRKNADNTKGDIDDLTPLDARESLLMDNPPRKQYSEMSNFNSAGPYEPFRHQYPTKSRGDFTGSTDRLVDSDYAHDNQHGRSMSRESRDSRGGSPEPRQPGYGYAY